MNAIELENLRIELAWHSATIGWPVDLAAIDRIVTVDNRIENPDRRFDRTFKFNRTLGVIDADNFVCWGGMGVHLESIGNPAFRAAIAKQTGITC